MTQKKRIRAIRIDFSEDRKLVRLARRHQLTTSAYLRLLIEQNNRTPLKIGA